MPLRGRSGQIASHFGTEYVAAAAEACSRLVGVCRDLRATIPPPPIPAPPAAILHGTAALRLQQLLLLRLDAIEIHRFS